MVLITDSIRADRLIDGPSSNDIDELVKWATAVTELLNRELIPVASLVSEIVNQRHGKYELVDAAGTIADDTEFLRVEAAGAVIVLPEAAIHPGPIFFTGSAAWTATAATGDTIDGGASASVTTGILVNDGVDAWRSI